MQEHDEPITDVGFVPSFEEIDVEYEPGTAFDVTMHDGSHMTLRKLRDDFNPTDKVHAVKMLMEAHENNEVLTGVFYVNTEKPTFTDILNLVDEPLATLSQERTRPAKEVLDKIIAAHQ
jgi:2-oxoglutarate ferredoxin oxidoreductase subunit beta